uniref:Large ribosomal subunit protein mL39 n=1 Tax=Daphnia lumholtzi TaxID=42856 RepID=A0A4Y7MD75_9CRUS|nr:EOG090X0A3R [Daphnia lumholtzi]
MDDFDDRGSLEVEVASSHPDIASVQYVGDTKDFSPNTNWTGSFNLTARFLGYTQCAYGLAKLLLANNVALQLGLFVTGCSPGGGGSNLWTYILGGNLHLSVTMTFLSTLAAFAMMPFWTMTLGRLIFAEGHIIVPYRNIATLAGGLVIPLMVGLLIRRLFPRVADCLAKALKPLAGIFICVIVVFGIYANLYMLQLLDTMVLLSATCLVLLGYAFGGVAAALMRQSWPDALTIAVETGIQNTGIAIFILRVTLEQPEADINTVVPLRIDEIRGRRMAIFDKEYKRQQALIPRLEKIEVTYEELNDEKVTLIMNKGISTPYNCAQHINEQLLKRSVVAEVNGEVWDMHRAITTDCTLKLLHMKPEDLHQATLVNKAFWRSCSFLLGAVVESTFQDEISVCLHSFPPANVRSGSFVYDVQLNLKDWVPSQNDLRQIAAAFQKFVRQDHIFQRLDVDSSVALKMFEDNAFKTEQIPHIATKSSTGRSITVYRVGDHIDISRGPMIASSSLVGRCSIPAIHKLNSKLYRFQGVALPSEIHINHFAFGILESRARKLAKSCKDT